METFSENHAAKSAASVVDTAADKLRGGIQGAQQGAKVASAAVADKVDVAGQGARRMIDSGTEQVKQGIDSVKGAVRGVRDSVSNSSEAMITYTQENPVKALMIAAASGALLWSMLKALAPSRDQ